MSITPRKQPHCTFSHSKKDHVINAFDRKKRKLSNSLVLSDLWFSSGRGKGNFVLQGVTLEIRRNKRVVIEGRPGAGLSTLHALAAGWRSPDFGEITLNNRLPCSAEVAALSCPVLFSYARDNSMSFSFHEKGECRHEMWNEQDEKKKGGKREVRICCSKKIYKMSLAQRMGVLSLDKIPLGELSPLEQFKLYVYKVLASAPSFFLVDEPDFRFSGRDARQATEILLDAVGFAGCGLLWMTHRASEAVVADEWWELSGGRLSRVY